MATCKWCGKSGLFLKVTSNGLCKTCDFVIVSETIQKINLINESTEIIGKSSNTDTILSRFDFIVETLNSLHKYELKGITTLKIPPSESLKIMNSNERDNHIVHGLEKELEKLKMDLPVLKTKNGRINKIQKFNVRVQEFKIKLINKNELNEVEKSIEELLNNYS